ncbi:hypothetical protein ANO11243_083240 [Dothideomycetidae sp. 11243]|nr:hypothetical protein ANO11243_083240 [fungal sp. No.11243]
MDSLPLEILHDVANRLDGWSLRSFSTVNKTIRTAAKPLLWHTVGVAFDGLADLSENVEELTGQLACSPDLHVVRRLRILGKEFIEYRDKVDTLWPLDARDPRDPRDKTNPLSRDPGTPYGPSNDESWIGLAEFIHSLTGLQELDWANSWAVPPCIFDAFSGGRHNRLFIRNLNLKSLQRWPKDGLELSDYDMSLITSPCLYSVTLTQSNLSLFQERLLWNILTLAPNLREVYFKRETPHGRYTIPTMIMGKESGPHRYREAALTCFVCHDPIPVWMFKVFQFRTDFTRLEVLKLLYRTEVDTFEWLVDNVDLSALHTVEICPVLDVDVMRPYSKLKFDILQATLDMFFQSLPTLRSIAIAGYYSLPVVETALSYSSTTLTSLELRVPYGHSQWIFSDSIIHKIADSCPQLQELTIPLRRSLGDEKEVTLYKDLGRLPKLKKFDLMLYCLEEPLLIERHKQDRNIYVLDFPEKWQRALQNTAIDRSLAEEIYALICQSKPVDAFPLEQLDLRVMDDLQELLPTMGIAGVFCLLGSSWRFTSNPADDSSQQRTGKTPRAGHLSCHAQHYANDAREEYISDLKKDRSPRIHGDSTYTTARLDVVKDLFLEIWPGSPQDDWWNGFKSLPLSS